MFSKLARTSAVCLLVLAVTGAPLGAQNTTGEISGYVRDGSQAVVPGVTVTLTFPELAYTRSTVTNSEGYYVFPGVPNGVADVSAELQGFQPAARQGHPGRAQRPHAHRPHARRWAA